MSDEREVYKIDKEDFDKIKLVPGNNKVLLKKLTSNKDQRTKSGIWIAPKPLLQNEIDHEDRVFEIIQVPKKLRYEKAHRRGIIDQQHKYFWTPSWKTKIEIKKGDIVLTAKIQIPKSVHLKCEGETYIFLDYHELYLALRPGKGKLEIMGKQISKIIPLNGFVICKTIKDYLTSKYIILLKNADDKIKRGKITHIGESNDDYTYKDQSDYNINVKPGQVIYKRNTIVHRDLENILHAVFDKEDEYFVIQRKDIIHAE